MRTLDRYLLREALPPFILALTVFTFVMQVQPMLERAEMFLARGMPASTVGYLLVLLLPQALGVTIPIAFLTGLLMALGRLSADREGVALLACGVSPLRLLRPVMIFAGLAAAANFYVMVVAIPDANLRFIEVTTEFLAEKSESEVRARRFYEGFPGKVLFVQDVRVDGTWNGVMLADTSNPLQLGLVLAESGRLVMDRDAHRVDLLLDQARRYQPGATGSDAYALGVIEEGLRIQIPAESVFGDGNLSVSRGLAEKSIADLRADIAAMTESGISPHNEIMYLHQKFSFPVACLVFGPIALLLGLHTRREGKMAGLVLGLAVVFVYYGLLAQAEAWTKGQHFPAVWARWVPNIALGIAGMALLVWKARRTNRQISFDRVVLAWRAFRRRRNEAAAGVQLAAPALVIRVPELHLPRPRLLDVYVSSRYLRLAALTFLALLGISYLAAFFDRSEKLFKGQADMGMLAQFLWYFTPQLITYIVPVATLIAVLGTIGGLTRTGELTVMRACGVSLYRTAMPLLLLAAAWSGGLFLLEERVLAEANQKASVLDDTIRGNLPHTTNVIANRHWLATESGQIYYYMAYDGSKQTLHNLSVFDTALGPYRVERHTYAARATWAPDEGAWNAVDGWQHDFTRPVSPTEPSRYATFRARDLDLVPAAEFESAEVDASLMTYGELSTYIARLEASGFSLAGQRMELQRKLAFPAVTLVMTLIAVPFGVTTGRRGTLYGIGVAIVLAISYFLLTAVFTAAGRAEVLPPVVAAWAANVFFLIAAAYLTLTART